MLAIFGMTTGTMAFYFFFHPPVGPDPGSADVVRKNGWSQEQVERLIVFGGRVDQWNLTAWTAVWTGACIGSIILVVMFEFKMFAHFRHLKDSAQNISENTRKMHRDFHRTLLAMAICPLFTTTAPLLYFSVTTFLAFPLGPISAFVEMAVTSITVFNPLTTICFMRCYRSAALRMLRCRRDAADANAVQLFNTDSLPS
ncbi:7TM GPCR protein [Aphelenchoides avenae]|nr:7TM GPCR protein [Aphelenchus avenae]